MQRKSLSWIRCSTTGCHSALSVGHDPPPDISGDEIDEAMLSCTRCGAEYPVLLGVALLVPALQEYFAVLWPEIERCARQLPRGISGTMLRRLGVASAYTGHAGPPPADTQGLEWSVAPYLQSHFDRSSWQAGLPEGDFKSFVSKHAEGLDPYRFLIDAATDLEPAPAGLAIDAGSSVGRGAAALAGLYEYCIGIDWSFTAVLAARRYLLSTPLGLGTYGVASEKGSRVQRRLPPPQNPPNLDFVVADAASLPVADGSASCLGAFNLLCAVPDQMAVLLECGRACRGDGLLLLASPYWDDSTDENPSEFASRGPEFIRQALPPEFRILREADMVPWLVRIAQRRWTLYLSHCVAARRA